MAVALLTAMYEDDADFTNTFRALGSITTAGEDELPASLAEVRARDGLCSSTICTRPQLPAKSQSVFWKNLFHGE